MTLFDELSSAIFRYFVDGEVKEYKQVKISAVVFGPGDCALLRNPVMDGLPFVARIDRLFLTNDGLLCVLMFLCWGCVGAFLSMCCTMRPAHVFVFLSGVIAFVFTPNHNPNPNPHASPPDLNPNPNPYQPIDMIIILLGQKLTNIEWFYRSFDTVLPKSKHDPCEVL